MVSNREAYRIMENESRKATNKRVNTRDVRRVLIEVAKNHRVSSAVLDEMFKAIDSLD